MRLALWRLQGQLWIDQRGYVRYAMSFKAKERAKEVSRELGGSANGGRVVWTGWSVPDVLEMVGAPQDVVGAVRLYLRAQDAGEKANTLKLLQRAVDTDVARGIVRPSEH